MVTILYWKSLKFCLQLKVSVLRKMFGKVLYWKIASQTVYYIHCKSPFFLVYCTTLLLCYYFQIHVFELILMSVYNYGLFELYVLSTVDTDGLGQTKLT